MRVSVANARHLSRACGPASPQPCTVASLPAFLWPQRLARLLQLRRVLGLKNECWPGCIGWEQRNSLVCISLQFPAHATVVASPQTRRMCASACCAASASRQTADIAAAAWAAGLWLQRIGMAPAVDPQPGLESTAHAHMLTYSTYGKLCARLAVQVAGCLQRRRSRRQAAG